MRAKRMKFKRRTEKNRDVKAACEQEYIPASPEINSFPENGKPVVLISCSKSKRSYLCEAALLYDESSLFRKSLAYAKTISDDIYVLSAKHGLVSLAEKLEPYEETLNSKTSAELSAWGSNTARQLSKQFNLKTTEFIILAGKNYYQPLQPYLSKITLPLLSLPMGERLARLDSLLNAGKQITGPNSICARLHTLFNAMPRFTWDTIDNIDFDNGIYILFEKGETYGSLDRIVRVGTHKSDGRLRPRLKDHFVRENKDGSIFRKNIGKAILNKNRHPYLDVWKENTGKPENILRLGSRYDPVFQEKVEKRVTEYMSGHFSFICFPVETEQARLRLEEGIIAALHQAPDFIASAGWRGKYSTEYEIVQSGLWLKQGLDGVPLTEDELADIALYCQG